MTSITIGLDIAKSVFQVHVEDAEGRTLTQRRLRRSQVVGHAPFPPERRAVGTLTPDRDRFGLRWLRGWSPAVHLPAC
jgi:hypothetical protein